MAGCPAPDQALALAKPLAGAAWGDKVATEAAAVNEESERKMRRHAAAASSISQHHARQRAQTTLLASSHGRHVDIDEVRPAHAYRLGQEVR